MRLCPTKNNDLKELFCLDEEHIRVMCVRIALNYVLGEYQYKCLD